MLDQVHELLACLGLLKKAGEIRGSRQGILFLHATHLHTHVLRLDHDHHAQRVQGPLDAILDLHRHTLLYLEAAGEDIHYSRILLKPVIYFLGI